MKYSIMQRCGGALHFITAVYIYVQVTYALPNNTHETDNLLKLKDNYRKIIITQNYYEFTQVAGIPIINIVDWLLDDTI